LKIPNGKAKGFIIQFCTIICKLIVFLLYDSLMMVQTVNETCWWRVFMCDWTYL